MDGARYFHALAFWLRRHDCRCRRFLLQGIFQHLVECPHVDDLHVAENFRRKISHGVRLVVRGQQHFLDARALGAKHLFLDSAMGSTTPDSVISPVIATPSRTGRPLSKLTSDVTIAAPAEGPSFGTAPDGTWM